MAEIDTSIYKTTQHDPLEQAQRALNIGATAQQIDTSKFELAMKQLNVLRGVTASFLSDPDAGKVDITKRIQDEASKMAAMGLYSPQQVVQFLKNFPKNPNDQYKSLIQIHASTLSAAEQLSAMLGTPSDLDTGGGTLTRQTPSYPGLPVRERAYVPSGLPPTATVPNAATLQPEYLGTGEPPTVQQRPGSLRAASGPAPRPGAIAPMQSSPPTATPGPAETPAPPVAAPAPGRIPATFPLGTSEAVKAGGEDLAEERRLAATYQERVNPTRNAIEILSHMKEGDVGPGSEQFNKLKSAAVTWGLGEIAGIDPQKVADFNKLRKYFEDAASRRATGLGPKTNDGLASALKATPNASLDKLSALDLSKLNLGLDRMRHALLLDFEGSQQPEGKFSSWRTQWVTQQDPRAYVYDLMSASAQKKLLDGMKGNKDQLDRFHRSLELAEKYKLLGDVNAK